MAYVGKGGGGGRPRRRKRTSSKKSASKQKARVGTEPKHRRSAKRVKPKSSSGGSVRKPTTKLKQPTKRPSRKPSAQPAKPKKKVDRRPVGPKNNVSMAAARKKIASENRKPARRRHASGDAEKQTVRSKQVTRPAPQASTRKRKSAAKPDRSRGRDKPVRTGSAAAASRVARKARKSRVPVVARATGAGPKRNPVKPRKKPARKAAPAKPRKKPAAKKRRTAREYARKREMRADR